MKLGDAEYVAKVQELLNSGQCVSRSEARRRISQSEEKMHTHKTMSEEEIQEEIKAVTGGAFETEAGRTVNYSISEDGKTVDVTVCPPLVAGETYRSIAARDCSLHHQIR